MPPTTSYRFGDIVLVPFPFTDQSATKRRPAVVLLKNWQAAGFLKPSAIKPVVTTIGRSLVIRALGRLDEEDQAALKRAIGAMLG